MAKINQAQPIVSVVVPLYNQQRYIKSCLRSLCSQTYSNLDIIIINDGSQDKSPLMAKSIAEKDHRIKVIDKQNEGALKARIDGIKIAKGEYLTFVDSDDTLPVNAIEILVKYAVRFKVDLVLGSMVKTLGFLKKDSNNGLYSFPIHQVVSQPELFSDYYLGFFSNALFPVSMCARLYRKKIIEKALDETALFDKKVSRMGEDQYFNMKLFPYLSSMYRTDQVVYNYRYGGGTSRFNQFFPQLFDFSDKRLKLLDYYGYDKGYAPLFDEYVSCLYYHAEQMLEYKHADRNVIISFFQEELDNRELLPRLIKFYNQQEKKEQRVRLIIERDYEGMLNYAYNSMRKRTGSIKYKAKKGLNKLVGFYQDITSSFVLL